MLGYILSIVVVVCYVRIVERKDSEYSGIFFIKKGLIEKTRNYTLKSKNDNEKTEMFNHLKSLNVDFSSSETLNKIINMIFDLNDENINVEILVIDYGDKITVNMKDEGKREVIENIEKTFSQDNVKVSEVLGLNNIEYTINEVKDWYLPKTMPNQETNVQDQKWRFKMNLSQRFNLEWQSKKGFWKSTKFLKESINFLE